MWICGLAGAGEGGEPGDFGGPEVGVGGFEDEGDVVEAGVGHEHFEEGFADGAEAERFVAVNVGAEAFFAVVEVHGAEVLQADGLVEVLPHPVVAVGGREVVAGGEGMAGVDADANALFVVDEADYVGELLK